MTTDRLRHNNIGCGLGLSEVTGSGTIEHMSEYVGEVAAPGTPAGPDAVAASVATLTGPALAGYLAAQPDPGTVDGYTLVELMAGWEKVARHARAQVLRMVGELGHRRQVQVATGQVATGQDLDHTDPAAPQVAVFAASEVSLALGTSHQSAQGLLWDAVNITQRLPQVLAAVESGHLHERAAHVISDETLVLGDHAAAKVAAAILARPTLRTIPQIKRATHAAVARVDPAGAAGRETRAVAGRYIRPRKAVEDGMVAWEAWLPLAQSIAIWDRLCNLAAASKVPGDPRLIDARRADAATDLLLGRPVLTPDGRNMNQGATPTSKVWRTDVIVAASTLAGTDEHPGLVPGWGPITADTARLLASGMPGLAGELTADAQWRRILTDPASGLVKDYGTTRYRPPAALADYIRARDGRCYQPYCLCSAWRGDLDHIRNSPAGPSPRPDPGGRTAADNFGAGCRRAHTTKAAPGWHVLCPTEGTFTWTTPTGHHYTRHPEPPIDWYASTHLDPDPPPEIPADPPNEPPF